MLAFGVPNLRSSHCPRRHQIISSLALLLPSEPIGHFFPYPGVSHQHMDYSVTGHFLGTRCTLVSAEYGRGVRVGTKLNKSQHDRQADVITVRCGPPLPAVRAPRIWTSQQLHVRYCSVTGETRCGHGRRASAPHPRGGSGCSGPSGLRALHHQGRWA